jgi:hypothetical protein
MFALASAPRFSTIAPDILHSENRVAFSLSLLNIGDGAAENLKVTGVTLGSALRLFPIAFPVFMGNLGASNSIPINASFASSGLSVGGKYLITVRGTYESGGATFGFTVNRPIVIPASVPLPLQLLKAHVQVSTQPGVWSYTLFNDEPLDSPLFIATFSLGIVAPVSVIGTPDGWSFLTDNATSVLWYATDAALPYPHHIAPGTSLAGFTIQSARTASEATGFVLTGWDHQANQAKLSRPGSVLSPSRS